MAFHLMKIFGKTPGCLTVDQLFVYLRQGTDTIEGRDCRHHLEICPACRAELELLKSFQEPQLSESEEKDVQWISNRLDRAPLRAARSEGRRANRQKPSPWHGLLGWQGFLAAGIAAAAVLAAVSLGPWQSAPPDTPQAPSSGPGVLRSTSPEIVQPLGSVEVVPRHLEWKTVAPADYFEASIYRVDRSLLWQARATGSRIDIPPEVQRQIAPGTRFLWQVSAWANNGQRLAASPLESFQVRAPQR